MGKTKTHAIDHNNDSVERPFQTLSSCVAWSCPWYRVRQDEILTPDGKPGVYYVVEKPDAVWIVPVTTNGKIALVRQYRYTVDDWCWEIPAGSLKAGQTPEIAAQDELLEEVGGVAESLDYIGRFYPVNGICNEVGHIFLARRVTLGPPQHEAAEVMEVHLFSIKRALDMARQGKITDGPSALALLLCAERLSAPLV